MANAGDRTKATDPDAGDGLLRRWSRRKHAAGAAPDDVQPRPPAPVETAAPVLSDADMPPVESLDSNSDFSGFLSPGVSKELRQLALRKLFHAPALNFRDGLDDYDDDYRNFEALGELLVEKLRQGGTGRQQAGTPEMPEGPALTGEQAVPEDAPAATEESTESPPVDPDESSRA